MLLQKKVWLPILIVLLVVIGCGLFYARQVSKQEPIKIYKAVEIEQPATTPKPPPPGETAESGHWHGDEWHADPHETHDTPAVSAGRSYIPEGAAVSPNFPPVDPNADPVEEAYKRLEYIKNNPYAWGGVHSDRATELIAQLMPPPAPIDHDHGEELSRLMYELGWQGDPRAAEVLIANTCEGYIGGSTDALVEIGPPAVPYILPYLLTEDKKGERLILVRLSVVRSLSRIGVRYRADLGGILDHIIIPKLEEIAADENNERYEKASVIYARDALSVLGR